MFYFLTNDCILEIAEYCKKSHSSITHFADQTFVSISRKFKDPLQEPKKKKNWEKLKLKIIKLINVISLLEKMILLNKILWEEIKNRLEKGEKYKLVFGK